MVRTGGRPWPAAVAVLVLPLGACGFDPDAGTALRSGSGSVASAAPATGQYQPTEEDGAAITTLLEDRARAVLRGDQKAFLATIDRTRKKFVANQKVLFRNLSQLDLSVLDYDVDATLYVVPADVPGDDPVLNPIVLEHVQIDRTLWNPVTNTVDMTFVRRGDAWLVADERDAVNETQERPWSGGPVVAKRDGNITALVDRERAGTLPDLLTAVRAGIQRDAELLGVKAEDRVLVDATSTGEPVGFSHVNATKAAAITKPLVTRDVDGRAIDPAGTLVKMNPDSVEEVVDDERLLWHELAHYLLGDYNGASPKWLSEGVASWTEWQPYEMAQLVVPAKLRDRVLAETRRLPLVGTFSLDPPSSYLISQAAVEWLVDQGGVEKVVELMRAYVRAYDGPNVDAHTAKLVKKVFGVTERQLVAGAWERLAQLHT